MIFQSGEFINILIIIMFFGSILLAWFLLCLFKYKKWHDRKLNCTKKLVAHVVEIREKKTARSGIITKPVFQVCDGGKVWHIMLFNSIDFFDCYYCSLYDCVSRKLECKI